MLIEGRSYTRAEIHSILGGGEQHYLPSVHGKIVCGCFSTDLNPQAPDVILPGNGPVIRKKARWLCEQGGSIPVFLKRAVNDWQYVGVYCVRDWTEDVEVIAQYARTAGRGDVSRVIFLRREGG